MRTVALYEMLFGVFTMVGGIIGYVSEGSVVSIVAGLLCGILLIFSALRMQKGSRGGLFTALAVSVVLLGRFAYNFFAEDGGFWPVGVMAILAILSVVLLGIILVQPADRKRDF